MLYKEFQPLPELAEYIQLIWALEAEDDTEKYQRAQIMPDGIVEVIFHYGEPFITHQSDGNTFKQPQSFAISQMTKFVEIESDGKIGFLSVRFFPWGAYHFFKEPISNFLDQTISIDKLWPLHYNEIVSGIQHENSIEGRLHLLQQFLLKRLSENRLKDISIDEAIKLIRHSKGQLTIEEVCEKVTISKKTLERKFLAATGTSPKIFSRITRFLNICQHLDEHKNKTLSQLTYECGYYDQNHFIKEFKEFSGFTPKEFFKKENVFFADL
jgi:AraC-like DNA-binding protein